MHALRLPEDVWQEILFQLDAASVLQLNGNCRQLHRSVTNHWVRRFRRNVSGVLELPAGWNRHQTREDYLLDRNEDWPSELLGQTREIAHARAVIYAERLAKEDRHRDLALEGFEKLIPARLQPFEVGWVAAAAMQGGHAHIVRTLGLQLFVPFVPNVGQAERARVEQNVLSLLGNWQKPVPGVSRADFGNLSWAFSFIQMHKLAVGGWEELLLRHDSNLATHMADANVPWIVLENDLVRLFQHVSDSGHFEYAQAAIERLKRGQLLSPKIARWLSERLLGYSLDALQQGETAMAMLLLARSPVSERAMKERLLRRLCELLGRELSAL